MSAQRYEVLEYFKWGSLYLEKGQQIEITQIDESSSFVKIYGREESVVVHPGSVTSKEKYSIRKI